MYVWMIQGAHRCGGCSSRGLSRFRSFVRKMPSQVSRQLQCDLFFGSVFHFEFQARRPLAPGDEGFFRSRRRRRGSRQWFGGSVLKVVVARSKQPIANVSQARQDDPGVRQVVVDHPDRHGNFGMILGQEFQSSTAGNNGDNVDLWDAPLRNEESLSECVVWFW